MHSSESKKKKKTFHLVVHLVGSVFKKKKNYPVLSRPNLLPLLQAATVIRSCLIDMSGSRSAYFSEFREEPGKDKKRKRTFESLI